MPSLKRSLASCGTKVSIGRGSDFKGNKNIHIGDACSIGVNAIIWTTRAEVIVGNYFMTGPNITIITGDHRTDILDRPMIAIGDNEKLPENDADVVIEDDVWVGANAIILKGVHIAKGCVVAAGAVVTNDIYPTYSIWGGCPARQIGSRINK
ncbi:acetyltransferase [Eggerthella sinensis]|uniref:Acetyltransferase n=2 Tax=Eggerthella sinensis TaxID=242230 RepID=A0A3N0IWM9_9ACTN|nr:acetyltransferase [Eggerthella sinensis]RNM41399.1 acetyltransferase [Eggerthella sinensis]